MKQILLLFILLGISYSDDSSCTSISPTGDKNTCTAIPLENKKCCYYELFDISYNPIQTTQIKCLAFSQGTEDEVKSEFGKYVLNSYQSSWPNSFLARLECDGLSEAITMGQEHLCENKVPPKDATTGETCLSVYTGTEEENNKCCIQFTKSTNGVEAPVCKLYRKLNYNNFDAYFKKILEIPEIFFPSGRIPDGFGIKVDCGGDIIGKYNYDDATKSSSNYIKLGTLMLLIGVFLAL